MYNNRIDDLEKFLKNDISELKRCLEVLFKNRNYAHIKKIYMIPNDLLLLTIKVLNYELELTYFVIVRGWRVSIHNHTKENFYKMGITKDYIDSIEFMESIITLLELIKKYEIGE